MLELVRPELRGLAGYSSARMESSRAGTLLNANESPWPQQLDRPLNRYPDPQPAALCARLAALYGVEPDQILASRGSDEAIDLLVRAFCAAGQHAVAQHGPTFGMYAVAAAVQGARVVDLGGDGAGRVDARRPDLWIDAIDASVRLVFVCAPNNPTGALADPLHTLALAQALEGRALVVVDEAYIEFSGTPGASLLVHKQSNLAVLRTLSKAHALAAARVGCLIAAPALVALLRRLMAPYPLPGPCVDAAMAATTRAALAATAARIERLIAERERVADALGKIAGVVEVMPSRANFLCVRFDSADTALALLAEAGIVVRDVRRQPKLGDALRITIGSPDENARVIRALERLATPSEAPIAEGVSP